MFGAADDGPVVVVVPEVERCAWQYRLEAAPTVDFAGSYHPNPHLAFRLKLFAVSTLRLGASRLVVCACMFGAVAGLGYAGASTECAYLVGHTSTPSTTRNTRNG